MKGLVRRVLPPLLAFLVICCVYAGVHLALGTQPFVHSDYDSYTLQALAWREGRMSLGRDYPHLELAVFEGDWYVSFPPVPSLVQLPLTLLFGQETPDGLLVKLYVAGAFWILYDYFRRTRKLGPWASSLWALFLVFASDMVSVSLDGGVWYQAQTLNFLHARRGLCGHDAPPAHAFMRALRAGGGLPAVYGAVWAGAAHGISQAKTAPAAVAGAGGGVVHCGLLCRLQLRALCNPFEFGHNYLPEFTRVETGQFSLAYVAGNTNFRLACPFPWKTAYGRSTRSDFPCFCATRFCG